MTTRRVLFVCDHPVMSHGAVEIAAIDLYRGLRASKEFEPIFLACVPAGPQFRPHPGTVFASADHDPNQYFFYLHEAHHDPLLGRVAGDARLAYARGYAEFLLAYRPDVVHFHHAGQFGYDFVRLTRNCVPKARIVYTLHEFMPICHHDGKMVRTFNHELCDHASPRRCHMCFPAIAEEQFFLRERLIKAHLGLVDLFIAPSRFVIDRYISWGIPPGKMRHFENGRQPLPQHTVGAQDARSRERFGFFGQFNETSGAAVLLRAMKILQQEGTPAFLALHGAGLELQSEAFQNEFRGLVEAAGDRVVVNDGYTPSHIGALMEDIDWVVVPSIWWETSPRVIHEAFRYGRPVICSDIGGMAERVRDGISGFRFATGNPRSLAETMRKAVRIPSLWGEIRAGIPYVCDAADAAAQIAEIYSHLLTGEVPCRVDE
jgi:glycosyltransferase involved in cell wall biosynthesis